MEAIKRNWKICEKCNWFSEVRIFDGMYHCAKSGSIMEGYFFEDGQERVKLNCFSRSSWEQQDVPDNCEYRAEYCIKEWNEKENNDGRMP